MIAAVAAFGGGSAWGAGKKPYAPAVTPLLTALSTRVPDLEAKAMGGDFHAQFALSILQQYGLRGVRLDPEAARFSRAAAMAPRPSQPITTYIAGLNGAPGRVSTIYLPKPSLAPALARQVDDCISALQAAVAAGPSALDDAGETFLDEAEPAIGDSGDSAAGAACGAELFAPLVTSWTLAQPWRAWPPPMCDAADRRCNVLKARVERLNRRDPVAEAASAAASGDFRLGGSNFIGPVPQGWSLPGVTCQRWTRALISRWHVGQDVVRVGDAEHGQAALGFIAAYNRRIVTDPAFPFPDICSEWGVRRAKVLGRTPRTAAEAARSGDLAKLTVLDTSVDINARDPFGATALEWAMARDDEPMALALLARNANPDRYSDGTDHPGPLALALAAGRFKLARDMLAKGATMRGGTGLCRFELWDVYAPEETPPNRGCTWAGLLAAKGQFDLLDEQAALGRLDPRLDPRGGTVADSIDGMGELTAVLTGALKARDGRVISRVLPHVGNTTDGAARTLRLLYGQDRKDLVRLYVQGRGSRAARSLLEAELWRAAAKARKDAALALLIDYGADLNFLSPARLPACREAATRGDEAGLKACIEDAAESRARLAAALRAGDSASFVAMLPGVADVREQAKPTLVSAVARYGDAAMLESLLARGAAPDSGSGGPERTDYYQGTHRPDLSKERPGDDYGVAEGPRASPVAAVALRGDARGLRLLVDAGVPAPERALYELGGLGNPPPGLPPFGYPSESRDTSSLPSGPGAGKLAAMALVISELVRTRGAASLEPAFASAVYSGYDDVLSLMITSGFEPSRVKAPEVIWSNWSSLGNPCKPSTGRLLVRSGLPLNYPVSDFSRWPPLHGLAAGCVNADSVGVLLETRGVNINQIDPDGRTALDIAIAYRRSALEAALRKAGGLRRRDMPGAATGEQTSEQESGDIDLSQSVED